MEVLQQHYASLMLEMEDKFETKLQIINKRFHVIESQLKAKIKQLESKLHQKREDLDQVKLKAKIISLEKQIQQIQMREFPIKHHQPLPTVQFDHFDELLQTIKKQLKISDLPLQLYPQIDNIVPNLIEVLPKQNCLLTDLNLLLYKFRFYDHYKQDHKYNELQIQRQQNKSSEQHVNDVMFAGGREQDFEISFNPKSQDWIKKLKVKEAQAQLAIPKACLKLTQSVRVQEQIIKIMKTQLEESFPQIEREEQNFKQNQIVNQFRQKLLIVERLNYSIQLLILGTQREDILCAILHLVDDLKIPNYILAHYLAREITSRDMSNLIYNRLVDFKTDLEIMYNFMELMIQYKRNGIQFPQYSALQHLILAFQDDLLCQFYHSLNV